MKRVAIAAMCAAMFIVGGLTATQPASAVEAHTDNPWDYTMTNANGVHGLRITGATSGNAQALEVKDYLDQPIFGVNLAGGAWVAGDNFSVFGGGDIFNPVIQLRPDGGIQLGRGGPVMYSSHGTPSTCFVRPAWIFSDDGQIWFCALSGGNPIRISGTGPHR